MRRICAVVLAAVMMLLLCGCGDVFAKAEAGDANAMFELGNMYYTGKAVEQDFEKAFMYFYDAADNGNAEAQEKLGSYYSSGTPYTDFLDEWVIEQKIKDTNFYYYTINEFSDEEYAERMKALNIKYPDALNLMNQVNTIVVREADGSYKIIQTLERWNRDTKTLKFYDLFTEAFLFDLPYDSEDDFIGEDNTYKNIDISRACNKIPYFDDKEIFEYGMCGYATYFTYYHLDELEEQAGVDYYGLDGASLTYMYPETYKNVHLKYTTEQIADNYIKTVPVNLQVTAQELGVEISCPEERKYADAWKISDEERAERYSKMAVTQEDEILSMDGIYVLTLRDAEGNLKMIPVIYFARETEMEFYSLAAGQYLFTIAGTNFGEYDYDRRLFPVNFGNLTKIVPYFADKTFVELDTCFGVINYMNEFINESKAQGLNYEYPDAGFDNYIFPVGSFTTNEVELSCREILEYYVTVIPLEMQVYAEELKTGMTP